MDSLWILNIVSKENIYLITPWILIITGILVQRRFVGRVATFTDTLAVNIHFSSLENLNPFLIFYANIGLLFGIIAIISYISYKLGKGSRLSGWFYYANWPFCSIVVGLIILFTYP